MASSPSSVSRPTGPSRFEADAARIGKVGGLSHVEAQLNRCFDLVDILSARSATSCCFHFNITVLQFKIHFFSFGHNSHSCCAGMNSAACFCVWYPLYPVNTTFEFEGAVNVFTNYLQL